MNRTRSLFYIILAIFLAIIATSLAFNVIDVNFLTQFFIGASVFSVGVVALDFLGIFGNNEDGHGDHGGDDGGADGGGDGDAGGDVGGDAGGDDGGDFDADGDFGDGHGDGESDGHSDWHSDGRSDSHGAGHTSGHTSGHMDGASVPVLSILAYLRMAVYFFLGFGPTGWAALSMGRSPLVALALAVPMGVLATVAAQVFFRFQRSNTDSTVARTDLVNEAATVTVSLTHTDMGKVRVQVGMAILEQYALAVRPDMAFQKGETVRIVKVTPECVYVD